MTYLQRNAAGDSTISMADYAIALVVEMKVTVSWTDTLGLSRK
ncbi:TPA: hypothetical protein ACKFO9_000198 [Enterococcus faecium]